MEISVKDMLEAGVYFGHQTSRWNPKMKPYIFGERDGVHIFDLDKTAELLAEALVFLKSIRQSGREVMLVGTKGQARKYIEEAGEKTGCPYVTERWLGGTITNWDEIKKRVKYYNKLETEGATGDFDKYTKKEQLMKLRELNKLRTNLKGIKNMTEIPGALFVVDVPREKNAILEARQKGIPVVAITDSNANPDMVDYIIPGNDDAIRSLEIIIGYVIETLGKPLPKKAEDKKDTRRRPVREAQRKL